MTRRPGGLTWLTWLPGRLTWLTWLPGLLTWLTWLPGLLTWLAGRLAEPQAVQRRPQDRPGIAWAAVDRRDGDDHVEDLFQGQIVADFVAALRGGEQRLPGREHPGPALAEDGVLVAVITVRQQFARDVVLAGEERGEPV